MDVLYLWLYKAILMSLYHLLGTLLCAWKLCLILSFSPCMRRGALAVPGTGAIPSSRILERLFWEISVFFFRGQFPLQVRQDDSS